MEEIYQLNTNTGTIPIHMIRSKRKSICLQIKETTVYLRMPMRCPKKEGICFIKDHQNWIIKTLQKQEIKLQHVEENPYNIPPYSSLSAKELQEIKKIFEEETAYMAKIMGVSYSKITIRNQKTRWGSCSNKGSLNFNYKLYYYPKDVRMYVIIHELAHRRYMNHSPFFWREIEKYMPDYKEKQKFLQ